MATKNQTNKSQDDKVVKKLCVMWCNLNRWTDPHTGHKSNYWTDVKVRAAMSIIEAVVPEKTLLKEWQKQLEQRMKS